MLTLRHPPFELLERLGRQQVRQTDLVPCAKLQKADLLQVVLELPAVDRGSIDVQSQRDRSLVISAKREIPDILPRTVRRLSRPRGNGSQQGDSPAQRDFKLRPFLKRRSSSPVSA